MRRIIILLCVICFSSCSRPESEYIGIVDKITNEYKKEVIEKYRLVIFGEGGGMMGDIQRTSLTFKKYDLFDVGRVRELVVKLEEQYLKMINENKNVRPYLHDYPAGAKNFKLSIIFGCIEKSFAPPPYIANVAVLNGDIYYSTYNKDKNMLDSIFSEPYEEAYKIVYGHEKK